MSEVAIEVSGLSRAFGTTVAVRDLSFSVRAGEVFGLLGHNGAGKTTTIRLLCGLLRPDSGTVSVLGRSPVTEGTAVRARCGVVPETPGHDERLTARENLAFFAELYGLPGVSAQRRVDAVLEEFGLAERADERVDRFSKGMKQRLALARCLLHDPEVLFLDEPTAGLDPVASYDVRELIRALGRRGRTVFLCTHNLTEAERLCDRVAVLQRGRLIALGSPAELAGQLGARQRLEIEVDPSCLARARAVLASLVSPHQVAAHDGGVVTVTGIARELVPRVVETLVRQGVPVYRVTPHEVSLEDVYLALHGQEERP